MNRKPNWDIVDIVLDIMEGPRPMKNLKVTEKNPNCVDQFWNAHQAQYEARGKMSRDRVETVNEHNLTFPRLGDELDNRKSLSKVTTNQKNDVSKRSYDSACAACTKLRVLNKIQKQYTKSKCKQTKMKSKTRSHDIKSRIRKNRYSNQKRIKTRLPTSGNRITKCHCCYIRVKNKRVGNDSSTNLNLEQKNSKKPDDMRNERMSSSSRTANLPKEPNSSHETKKVPNKQLNDLNMEEERSIKSSIKTLKNPDTSIASMSSYNSYASLDHEPMVNMEH